MPYLRQLVCVKMLFTAASTTLSPAVQAALRDKAAQHP